MRSADSLDDLRRREKGWASLRWRKRFEYRMPNDGSLYELQQGFFARGLRSTGPMQRPNTLWLQPLPRGDVERIPMTIPLGFQFCDFNMDVEQNLCAAICPAEIPGSPNTRMYGVTMRLHKLTDGLSHPSARLPLLDLNCLAMERSNYFIQIHGDFIGVLMNSTRDNPDRFWLYDWKQGVLQAVCDSYSPIECHSPMNHRNLRPPPRMTSSTTLYFCLQPISS